MSSEETFSINAAAKLTGYSVPTIRKRLGALSKAGAVQVEGGLWQIPLSALHAVGLMVKVEGEPLPGATSKPLAADIAEQVNALQVENGELLRRALVAEAVAAERLTALERADRVLLMLEARQPPAPSSDSLTARLFRRR